jgi:hypothetical protein
VHALVRLERLELGLLVFVHRCLPPGGYISLSCLDGVGSAFVYTELYRLS